MHSLVTAAAAAGGELEIGADVVSSGAAHPQYKDRNKPINMYINSTGTTRADGESVSRRHPVCLGMVDALLTNGQHFTDNMPVVTAVTLRICNALLQVGFETEGTAIFDTMSYVGNEVGFTLVLPTPGVCASRSVCFIAFTAVRASMSELLRYCLKGTLRAMPAVQIHTVGVGVAIGQSCMLLSAGTKGRRFMLPHATGALPRQLSLLLQSHHCAKHATLIELSQDRTGLVRAAHNYPRAGFIGPKWSVCSR